MSERRGSPERHEQGDVLIVTLIVLGFLMVISLALVATTTSNFQQAGAYRDMGETRQAAEAGLQHIAAKQNDNAFTPRYLFQPGNYVGDTTGVDPVFDDFNLTDPETGEGLAVVSRRIVNGKDPLIDPPPYRVRASTTLRGTTRTIEADLAPLSLLEYALWTEASVTIAPYITYTGKVYSATYIRLNGSPITFRRSVEYVTNLYNQHYGTYDGDIVDLAAAKPALTSLVDMTFYDDASKGPGVCDEGTGLYIGTDTGQRHDTLFRRSGSTYEIDLTLFDFSGPFQSPQQAISYNGVALEEFNTGNPLIDFNGIIVVDGELHVWGINGGRSIEDYSILDSSTPNPSQYDGPFGVGGNTYSNNLLDPTEDGSNGGVVNGVLDPAMLGQSLTIVTTTGNDIFIDHNVFMGVDPLGTPVRMALISGRAVHVLDISPKTITIQAALMGLGTSNCSGGSSTLSWYPCGTHSSHVDNYWAERPDGTYVFDTDRDGTIETDNGAYRTYDRDETDMLDSWSLQVFGNRIFSGRPSSGHWAGDSHMRFYTYDETLVIYEPPCYPVLPEYDLVAGSVTEVRP